MGPADGVDVGVPERDGVVIEVGEKDKLGPSDEDGLNET